MTTLDELEDHMGPQEQWNRETQDRDSDHESDDLMVGRQNDEWETMEIARIDVETIVRESPFPFRDKCIFWESVMGIGAREISADYGMSRSRVAQIVGAVTRHLRAQLTLTAFQLDIRRRLRQ